jgi:hypothetical protein
MMLKLFLVLLVGTTTAAFSIGPRPGSPAFDGTLKRNVQKTNSDTNPFVYVTDYGAVGDNKTDCTKGFQAALDFAKSNRKGGVVYAPPGLYVFLGSINVPQGVTLQGSYNAVPSHGSGNGLDDGTVLVPTFGRGNTDPASAFISVATNAVVTGLVVYYKNQPKDAFPAPYPWSILMVGDNSAVTDVELLNAWNGINATLAGRHYIARVQGQPLNIGVFVDQTYDIGRIEDVHFNPWYSPNPEFMKQQLVNGRAFVFGRSDWEYVFNTFAFGYAIGYHFIQTPTGEMNGNFLGLGADLMINASVRVDASQPAGLLITNGEFTAFSTKQWLPTVPVNQSSQVVISSTNTGPVKFVNSAFWGPSSSIARVEGSSVTTFSGCQFVEWGEETQGDRGLPAVAVKQGKLIITSSVFHQNKLSIALDESVSQAVIQGNVFSGTKEKTMKIPSSISKNTNRYAILGNSFTD